MSSIFDPLRTAHRALDYHLERHNVLASNVANVDTPGFRPEELVRETSEPHRGMRVARTDDGHMQVGQSGDSESKGERFDRVAQPGGDGNSVSLEREMAKVGANDLRFETVGRFVKHQLGMLRYAASDGNG